MSCKMTEIVDGLLLYLCFNVIGMSDVNGSVSFRNDGVYSRVEII